MTGPEPRTEYVVTWCVKCATATSELLELEAHRWAADHARENGHRTAVRVKQLSIYGENK